MSEVLRLTQGEKLLINRLRLGLTQQQAADLFTETGSRKIYQQMEGDLRKCSEKISLGKLEHHERCRIMRRRCGFTQQRVAEELQVSRYWLNLMETGKVDCSSLLWYWEN